MLQRSVDAFSGRRKVALLRWFTYTRGRRDLSHVIGLHAFHSRSCVPAERLSTLAARGNTRLQLKRKKKYHSRGGGGGGQLTLAASVKRQFKKERNNRGRRPFSRRDSPCFEGWARAFPPSAVRYCSVRWPVNSTCRVVR